MPLSPIDRPTLENYAAYYRSEGIRVPEDSGKKDVNPLSEALFRTHSITAIAVDLAILSLFPNDRNQPKFAQSLAAASTAMVDLFKPFFTPEGEYNIKADPDAFKKVWDDFPTKINNDHFENIVGNSGIELPPGITPDNLKDNFSWRELWELTLRLLPMSHRESIGGTPTKEEFDNTILTELNKMIENDSTKEYALELQPRIMEFLSRDIPEADPNSSIYPALELKARGANLIWQVCQPFRYAKDVATSKEHTSTRLSKTNFEPFDEMLRAVYESHLGEHAPTEAIVLTALELWKDLSH